MFASYFFVTLDSAETPEVSSGHALGTSNERLALHYRSLSWSKFDFPCYTDLTFSIFLTLMDFDLPSKGRRVHTVINIISRCVGWSHCLTEYCPETWPKESMSTIKGFFFLIWRPSPSGEDSYNVRVSVDGKWLDNTDGKAYCGGECVYKVLEFELFLVSMVSIVIASFNKYPT